MVLCGAAGGFGSIFTFPSRPAILRYVTRTYLKLSRAGSSCAGGTVLYEQYSEYRRAQVPARNSLEIGSRIVNNCYRPYTVKQITAMLKLA